MERYVGFITQDLRAGVAIIFACLVLIVFACLLDMWTGIDAARASKEKICSRPLRQTGTKIVDYYRLVMFFILHSALAGHILFDGVPMTAGVILVNILDRRKEVQAEFKI